MHQSDFQLRQRGGQRSGGFLRRLIGHLLRFIDERADPVGLAAFQAGGANPLHHLVAPRLGEHDGLDRRATGRQFVNHRHIEIGVGRHRQRAGNRRGGHDELVRLMAVRRAFLAQAQALVHAEAVLLIDHHQCQRGKLDALLKQGVRADDDSGMTQPNALEHGAARLARQPSAQNGHRDAERLEPAAEILRVLIGEQFGRRHQRDLASHLNGLCRRQGRNQSFTAAHIALHQTQHRQRPPQVAFDLEQHALLRGGHGVGQRGEKVALELARRWQRPARIALYASAQQLER